MRIDRSDQADGPGDSDMANHARSAPDDPDAAGKDWGKEVSTNRPADSSAACPDSAVPAERSAAYHAKVDAAYQQYAIDHGSASVGQLERATVIPAMRRLTIPGNREHELYEVGGSDDSHSAYRANRDVPVVVDNDGDGGDVPDDPRNYSNSKTGRLDASWSTYDRAIAAAREHTGGDLGPNSIKMYDYNPETGEGTGTLIGEQTPDRLRGWRIDGRDGHVNWWDWTAGKKGAGGVYGHDWFPEDASTPGSRYIGWAPWQDSNGNVLEGN